MSDNRDGTTEKALPKGVVRSREVGLSSPPSPPPLRGGGGSSPASLNVNATLRTETNARRPAPLSREAGEGRGERAETPRITALTPQEKREGRISIFLDGEFALGVYEDVAIALGLRIGQPITAERLAEVAQAETARRAREDAYRLLGYRARSEKEISQRLTRRGYEPEVVAHTLAHLQSVGFLDDEAFAQSWSVSRGKGRGRAALAHELRQKGIDAETVARVLEETRGPVGGDTERDAAYEAAVKKVGERPADTSREAQARLAAYLQRRGFGWDTIRPILARLYQARTTEES